MNKASFVDLKIKKGHEYCLMSVDLWIPCRYIEVGVGSTE